MIRGGDNLLTPSDRLSELAPFWSTESTAAKKDARSAVTADGQVDANAVGGWLASTLGLNELLYPPTPSPAAALLELDTAPLQAPPPAAGSARRERHPRPWRSGPSWPRRRTGSRAESSSAASDSGR